MNGLLLVDKPCGLTSFDVVRKVRRWARTRQVGHCGTLDPAATGVLPVAIGSATRLVEYLMAADKEYLAVMRLGTVTDSQDGDGRVLATYPCDAVDRAALEAAAHTLVGAVRQVPPMHSALKRDGVPLYRLAHQGLSIEREAREIRVDAIDVLDVVLPDVSLRVACGKGTYVRTLCHDFGALLGCGAHLAALRRTRCGRFAVGQCHTVDALEALTAAGAELTLISCAEALGDWPGLAVRPEAFARLANGVAPRLDDVDAPSIPAEGAAVRLLVAGELAAVARFVPGGEGGRPGDFALDKVFPDAFPR